MLPLLIKKNINYLYKEFNETNCIWQDPFNIDILKIFIHLYYFNKSLYIGDKNKIFNDFKCYFLINPDWLNKFKELYDYENIFNFLQKYDLNNNHINLQNLSGYETFIINDLKKQNLNITQNLNLDNIDIKLKTISKDNLNYYKAFFIIPDNIEEMIKKLLYKDKPLSIMYKKLFVNNNDIYLIDGMYIYNIIFNEEFLFIPKYIFLYKSKVILETEKNIIKSYTIQEYIKLYNCSENNFNVQHLIENKENIGDLLILDDNNNNQEIIQETDEDQRFKKLKNNQINLKMKNIIKR